MSESRISDEAVEAAAKQLAFTDRPDIEWGQHAGSYRNRYRDISRKALEAAAPHLMAQAWDEGAEAYPLCDAAVSCGACHVCMDPYLVNPYRAGVGE